MEGHGREDGENRVEGTEPDSSNPYDGEPMEERAKEDDLILEEFEKKRRHGKIEYVQSVLEGILFRIGVEVEVVAEEKEGEVVLEIRGDQSGLLIGKHGRTLDALQYVLNKVCQRRFGEGGRVLLDAENYRRRRVEALENLSLRLGEKVKRKKRALVAGVFNSRDRRVIHMTLKDDPAVETESRGEGFYKKLVIRPRMSGGGREDTDLTP